jgi:hypothetical protein
MRKTTTVAANSEIAIPVIEGTSELAAAVFLFRHARKTVKSFEKPSEYGLF